MKNPFYNDGMDCRAFPNPFRLYSNYRFCFGIDTHTRSTNVRYRPSALFTFSLCVWEEVSQGHPFYRHTNCCGMFYLCETTNDLAEPPFILYTFVVHCCMCFALDVVCTKHITAK